MGSDDIDFQEPQPNGVSEEDRLVDRIVERLGQLGVVPHQRHQSTEP